MSLSRHITVIPRPVNMFIAYFYSLSIIFCVSPALLSSNFLILPYCLFCLEYSTGSRPRKYWNKEEDWPSYYCVWLHSNHEFYYQSNFDAVRNPRIKTALKLTTPFFKNINRMYTLILWTLALDLDSRFHFWRITWPQHYKYNNAWI